MDDYEKILARTDLRQISHFLLDGAEAPQIEQGALLDMVWRAQKEAHHAICHIVSDRHQQAELLSIVDAAYHTMEAAYLELGIRAGLRLLLQ